MTGEKWLEAQYSVLGSVLIDERVAAKVLHETSEQDYRGTCLTVFKAVKQLFLAGSAIDPVSVVGVLGSGYQQFVLQLMEITPTAANVDSYIALCREQGRMVQAQDLMKQAVEADSIGELRKILEKINGLMVDKGNAKVTTMTDALRSFNERHVGAANFLHWPVQELDQYIFAKPGRFIVIGGLPSTGKTAWSLQCAWFWAKDKKVGFFSLETDDETLFDRQISSMAQIDKDVILRNQIPNQGWDKICALTPEITGRNLEIIEAAGFSVADIRAMTLTRGYDIIVVDYLQLVQAGGYNRTEQVTAVSIALHTLAQTLHVTVVALAQLNRDSSGSKSDMARLRESGQIEQDADIIMMLKLEDEKKPMGQRILSLAKNKESKRMDIPLAFNGETQTFSRGTRTSETVQKYSADGKRARAKNRMESVDNVQMSILPGDTPVPFPE